MEGHAIKERVVKRMSVLGEKLWATGKRCGSDRRASMTCSTSARKLRRDSIVYGQVEG